MADHQQGPPLALGHRLGRGCPVHRYAVAGSPHRHAAARARPVGAVPAHQRHLRRHLGQQSGVVGIRDRRLPDGYHRVAGHLGRSALRLGATGSLLRGCRHAAGSLDRLAPRHQSDDPVPLPDGRHHPRLRPLRRAG